MKKYQYLFFDVDDTLLDFRHTEKRALERLFAQENIVLTDELRGDYHRYNKGLWHAHERGEIGKEELLNTRFTEFFRLYGKQVDGLKMERSYRNFLSEGHEQLDGALSLIQELSTQYELYIMTNGVAQTQNRRLRDSGLFPYFKNIFISEETGFHKPMKSYFDYCFQRIDQFNCGKALIIGDSLVADIKGGLAAGMDACWMNVAKVANDTDITPTYEINKLVELLPILEGRECIDS